MFALHNGLGLSMVAAVADLNGVRLSVDDNRPGLRMTMSFPCSQSHPVKKR